MRKYSERFQRKNTIAIFDWLERVIEVNGNFLDVGCSDGWTIEFVQKRFCNTSGVGISIDKGDVSACKEFGVKCFLGDAEKMPFKDGEFSFVYSHHMLEHSESPFRCVKEFMRVVCDDGFVLVSVPEYNLKYLKCDSHKYVMPVESWRELFFRAGLELVGFTSVISLETDYVFLLKKLEGEK